MVLLYLKKKHLKKQRSNGKMCIMVVFLVSCVVCVRVYETESLEA